MNPNEIFLCSVPRNSRSTPERSKPCWVIVRSTVPPVGLPRTASTGWCVFFSKCHCGVVLTATGQYAGFCHIGASLSFPSWYPLSRNFCPKLFSSGQVVWHAEHGRLY